MLSLLEGEKKLSELGKIVQTRETTILHALKELEQIDLTTKTCGVYKLTPLGTIEAQICKMCQMSCKTLEKHKKFWLTHDISAIPPALMMNLGAIENSIIVKATDVDLQKVHEKFTEMLFSSKTILGISPIFHPDYVEAFIEISKKNGSKIELIVTQAVLEKIKQEVNNDLLAKHISEGNLQVFLNDNLKFALTITEKELSLGLFNLSGEYDYANDLICNGEEGLEWGRQLFKETLKKSVKM